MNFIGQSLSRKITSACLAVFLLGFLTTGILLFVRLGRSLAAEQRSQLVSENHLWAKTLETLLRDKGSAEKIQVLLEQLGGDYPYRVTVISKEGAVLADSRHKAAELSTLQSYGERPEVASALKGRAALSTPQGFSILEGTLYSAEPVAANGQISGVVRLALPLETLHSRMAAIRDPLLTGFALAAMLVALAGFGLGKSLTAKLRRLALTARQVAGGDLRRKALIETEDELRTLGESLNHLASSLRQRILEAEGEKQKLTAILENIGEGILAVDAELKVVAANASLERILNLRRQEIIGRNLLEVLFDYKIHAMLLEAVRDRQASTRELQWAGPPVRTLNVSAAGIQDPASVVAGVLVLTDMTQIRKLENLRRDFVANVSHELKTPLTSIHGFIETLLGGALNDRAQSEHFLRLMGEDTARLSRLIQDILELSKIESGQALLNQTPLNLQRESQKAVEKLRPALEQKKVTIENKISAEIPAVLADRDKLAQIFLNLLDNAIKFNRPGGTIILHAEKTGGFVRVSIEDSGPGISPADLPRVFERFYRSDRARARESGGTGLGLAIVKHLVEAHGGEVGCRSELGKGSCFHITLKTSE